MLVVLPFWTNFLVRTYAWIVLLNSEGPVNGVLMDLGLIGQPLGLLYTPGAIVAGLLYAYLPLMILPLYVAIERLDPELREAAANLGASQTRTFLTRDAAADPAGCPDRLHLRVRAEPRELRHPGAARAVARPIMVGNLIRDQFLEARDWPFGSVLALSVLGLLFVLLALQSLLARRYAPVAHG